ncbi:MAG: type III-A CRISPR-associated protein Csm2 [Thermodesulfobacteriota bacterium]
MPGIHLWKDREKQILEPVLFSAIAEGLAKRIAEAGQKRDKHGNPVKDARGEIQYERNRASQIRKFYDEVIRLNIMSRVREAEWEFILPMVHMVTAKAAYAEGRKLTSHNFTKFIQDCVGQVKDRRDLDVFANLFEAFMGYYKLHGPKS